MSAWRLTDLDLAGAGVEGDWAVDLDVAGAGFGVERLAYVLGFDVARSGVGDEGGVAEEAMSRKRSSNEYFSGSVFSK